MSQESEARAILLVLDALNTGKISRGQAECVLKVVSSAGPRAIWELLGGDLVCPPPPPPPPTFLERLVESMTNASEPSSPSTFEAAVEAHRMATAARRAREDLATAAQMASGSEPAPAPSAGPVVPKLIERVETAEREVARLRALHPPTLEEEMALADVILAKAGTVTP